VIDKLDANVYAQENNGCRHLRNLQNPVTNINPQLVQQRSQQQACLANLELPDGMKFWDDVAAEVARLTDEVSTVTTLAESLAQHRLSLHEALVDHNGDT
jgi:hypothetical protein